MKKVLLKNKKTPWWGIKVGWPFLTFVIITGIGGLSLLLCFGYQDVFALRETSVQTTEKTNGDTVALGEGIVVDFNEPIQTENLSAAVYPTTKIRLSFEEGVTGKDAKRVRVIPEELPRPGNTIVVVLSGLKSVFGTELPERRYAFPTQPLPSIKTIQCAQGTEECVTGDPLTVEWTGDRTGFVSRYLTEDGQSMRVEKVNETHDLLYRPETAGIEANTIVIQLFERGEGLIVGKEAVKEAVSEERYQITSG